MKTIKTGIEYFFELPEGYQFVDENGNVINAQKIVLEKKKKDVSLTQEQINTMIYDSCVLFCKHCGCGIPRETCTSLGTCEEHDEYRNAIRIHLMEKKKKEYPKTYEECCTVLRFHYDHYLTYDDENDISPTKEEEEFIDLMDVFSRLIICRNAYWKIAGEEMGLGKPWEPSKDKMVYSFYRHSNEIETNIFSGESVTFEFPTEEMRDAFYENFKELIEQCQELL